ncbi:AAA family ATPase [Sphingopyxis sp. USTB-05]|uniref:AAA family ATPase n=1 Tax=Sphingopyxis sp. USTB-05 TaxID=2830667 RepID=UPI002078CAB8|nr:AAA family ATPase [Sphingopyxis sp. USTB-05]USI79101.1 AAA family ATPase [Sphingopyxis sp. USTB-05]
MLTREAVLETLDEFDRTTLSVFVEAHGFGEPQKYWIAERGKLYPCKAITNVAIRKVGGEPERIFDATRSRKMVTRLGFEVVERTEDGLISREAQADDARPDVNPTNLILYGPPGTGKTFHTAEKAVRLCDGTAPSTRAEVLARYEALRKAGQIDFVTFHQSYAYEEFVEGMRPVTGGEESDEDSPSVGFRLEPKTGIFRDICALAEQSRKAAGQAKGYDLAGRQIFKMSLGRAGSEDHIYDAAIDGNYIVLGWGGDIDWSDSKYDQYQAIHDKWNEIEPGTNGNDGNISQIWRFRTSMEIGDLVVVSAGNSYFRAIGEIVGPYEYQPTDVREYNHRRAVRWLLTLDEPLPVETIHDGKFTMRSCYRLKQSRLKHEALSRLLPGSEATIKESPDQFVLIIDEINRANISKVFGELITLIEDDKRVGRKNAMTVKLPYSGDNFGVPDNLHIIGTMNTADRSIALLDTALRRRFTFQELMPRPELLKDSSTLTGINLVALLRTLNERIEYLFDREHQIGHAYFMHCADIDDVHDVMRHRIIPLLAEYFYEDWSKVALVLGDADGAGRFVTQVKLMPPAGMQSDGFGEERYRWSVRDEFDDDVYDYFG